MTEAQIQLQNALTTTFLANLAFLSEYDNELYHRVDELSRMIEDETYEEKYALEFIMESGDFDIYDIVNDKYLYNKNPKKINEDLIVGIQFDEKNSIFNIESVFQNKTKIILDNNERYNFETLEEFQALVQNDMLEYSSLLGDIREKRKLKYIKKFIFFGTLLGRHIPKIAQKINADVYLVCERNLEIFRLSLFTVDYTILAYKKGVIFSIMEDSFFEEKKITDFIYIDFWDNYLLKFSTTNININKYVDTLLSILVSQKPGIYDYKRRLYSYVNRTSKVVNSNFNVLQMNEIHKQFHFFNDKPILYLAAGPSLEENISWIKDNQNKFFIVTIGAAYRKLLDNNIKIDIITTLDEQYGILNEKQFSDESVSKISKDTLIFASTITNEKILNKFNDQNLFLYEINIPFHKNNISFKGFSIGEVTLDILLKMNAKEIYLIGLDLSLNQKTGETHFSESNSGIHTYDLSLTQERDFFNLRSSIIKVKGNKKSEVFTTIVFYSSIKYLEKILRDNLQNKTNIYNLSSQGAFFNCTIPKNINEIDILTFKDLEYNVSRLINEIRMFSLKNLSEESKIYLLNQQNLLKYFLENDLYVFKNKKHEKNNDFLDDILELINLNEDSTLNWVIDNYISFLLPFLKYYFNNKKVKEENKKIKEIKEIFVRQIEIIFNDYIFCIERTLK